jgi:hypothetical protein
MFLEFSSFYGNWNETCVAVGTGTVDLGREKEEVA